MYPADEALALARGVSPRSEHTAHEELVHAVTHGMGFIAAAVGLIVLLVAAGSRGTLSDVIGVCTFGVTLLVLYGASTLYHGLPQSRSKDVMRKLDHIAIYLLIAGTYTPFLLIEPPGLKSDVFLAVIWGLAGFGIILELARKSSTRRTSVVIYLGMGWLAVFALEPLFHALEFTGLVLLVLGGLSYSLGVIFYAWNRLPYNHAIWHGFVLCGSAFHFASVLGFVIS
jgi:hemolysin III